MSTQRKDVAIAVKDIKKTFRLPHEKHSGLKQVLINLTRKNRKKGYEVQQVLKGLSFEVEKGDFFGIVGRNGSGKSTLLKLLAGIYTPDSGSVTTNGSVIPFIELGVGFSPDLTGRENIFMNGALLGFSRKEIELMYDDIVDFAELERFMDQKLKNYSSGMQVRLAFSIAIQAQGDILILDEVLAVGDEAFQRKCNEYFTKIKKDKTKTVILVTHSMDSVRRYCNKAILIDNGEIVSAGSPESVSSNYSKQFITNDVEPAKNSKSFVKTNRYGSGKVTYDNIKFELDEKQFVLDFDIVNNTDELIDTISMGFDFCVDEETIMGNDTRFLPEYKSGIALGSKEKRHYTLKFDNVFGNRPFTVNANVTTEMGLNPSDVIRPALKFTSNNVSYWNGFKILAFPEIITDGNKK